VDQRYAVEGAQPVSTLKQAIERALGERRAP
jgi:predicted DsbA family dithiol-disulfide isomerase